MGVVTVQRYNATVTPLMWTAYLFTANGTWAVPSQARAVRVMVQGAGGGGGGGHNVTASYCGAGGGGGGGGYCDVLYASPSSLGSSVSVVVGAGGVGGTTATRGYDGGTTSFGAFISAPTGRYGVADTSGAGSGAWPTPNLGWGGPGGAAPTVAATAGRTVLDSRAGATGGNSAGSSAGGGSAGGGLSGPGGCGGGSGMNTAGGLVPASAFSVAGGGFTGALTLDAAPTGGVGVSAGGPATNINGSVVSTQLPLPVTPTEYYVNGSVVSALPDLLFSGGGGGGCWSLPTVASSAGGGGSPLYGSGGGGGGRWYPGTSGSGGRGGNGGSGYVLILCQQPVP